MDSLATLTRVKILTRLRRSTTRRDSGGTVPAQFSREDLAWAAGLFEGEGSFSTRRKSRDRGLLARMQMTDEDVVRRFHSIIRVGNVTGPYFAKGKKPIWIWQVGSFEGVQHVVASLWEWLQSRRRWRSAYLLQLYHLRFKQLIRQRVAHV